MFDAGRLTRRLAELVALHGTPRRMLVGFSGGVDSAVLLHSLVASRPPADVIALHVDHGLHADAAAWAESARAFAEGLGVTFIVARADVDPDSADGPEAAARSARYAEFEARIEACDWLLSAHHADDQAETLLLNLLRGSGPLGLAGMQAARPLGRGLLVRPLLDVRRAEIVDYAVAAGIPWTEDPANSDTRFDRNFLRHDLLPQLAARWPAVADSLSRSAALAADAQQLLDELASQDLAAAGSAGPGRIPLDGIAALSRARQANLLRYACRSCRLPLPPAARLATVLDDLVAASGGASPLVRWSGAELRRFRNTLFLLPSLRDPEPAPQLLTPGNPVPLGADCGTLMLAPGGEPGIRADVADRGLAIGFRQGGERLRPGPNRPTRDLKKLLQEAAVLPWMRGRIPLLRSGDELVAVGDLWVDARFLADDGYRVIWRDRPAIR